MVKTDEVKNGMVRKHNPSLSPPSPSPSSSSSVPAPTKRYKPVQKFCGFSLQELQEATGIKEFHDIMKQMETHPDWQHYRWVKLGGDDTRSHTASHTHACTHAKFALRENIVNAQDAVMKRLLTRMGVSGVSSVAEARTHILEVVKNQKGNSHRYYDPTSSNKNEGDFVRIDLVGSIAEQQEKNRLVVDLRDRGIGVTPEEFPTSIGSLEKSGKSGDPLQIGALGHGGAAIHRWCLGVQCFSRAHGTDEILYTIFKTFRDTQVNGKEVGLPTTFYLAHKDTGIPIVFNANSTNVPFDVGTQFRLVGLQFERGRLPGSLMGSARKPSVLHYLDEMFPDPVVPIWLNDAREDVNKTRSCRPITGTLQKALKQARSKKNKIVYANKHVSPLTISYEDHDGTTHSETSKLEISYFVQVQGDDLKKNYMRGSDSFILMHNGYQVDTIKGLTPIRDLLKLNHLTEDLFGVISLDSMGTHPLWTIMNSNREQIADTYKDAFVQFIFKALSHDSRLVELDKEFHAAKKKNATSSEDVNEELAKEFSGANSHTPTPPTPTTSTTKRKDETPPDSITPRERPKLLEFRDTKKEVISSHNFQLGIKTDIYVGYLKPENLTLEVTPKKAGSPTIDVSNIRVKPMRNCGSQNVSGYWEIVGLEMPESAEEGTTYYINLRCDWSLPGKGTSLSMETVSPIPVIARDPEPKADTTSRGKQSIKPDVSLAELDPHKIAEAFLDGDTVEILVNSNHEIYNSVFNAITGDGKYSKKTDEYMKVFAKRYCSEIGFAILTWIVDEENKNTEVSNVDEEPTHLEQRIIQAAKSVKRHFLKHPPSFL